MLSKTEFCSGDDVQSIMGGRGGYSPRIFARFSCTLRVTLDCESTPLRSMAMEFRVRFQF